MSRKLPTYEIEGTTFIVDIDKKELREVDYPRNTLAFADMKQQGLFYVFLYDRSKRRVHHNYKEPNEHVVPVFIPQMARLDPEGMAQKYGKRVEEIAWKSDFEVMINQERLAERLNGKMPKVMIAGEPFIYDVNNHHLRLEANQKVRLNLNDWNSSKDGREYIGYYHLPSRKKYHIKSDIVELPKDVVMLKVPNEIKMDPVGVAMKSGLDLGKWLMGVGFPENVEAKIIPLNETGLPTMIEKNLAHRRQLEKGKANSKHRGKRQ